jgi:transcriptional regulator with XRE-family HTH domain
MSSSMTLAEWRRSAGLSQKDMAGRLTAILGRKVHAPSICQWERGVMPGADVAEAIRAMSDGAVTGDSYGKTTCPPA